MSLHNNRVRIYRMNPEGSKQKEICTSNKQLLLEC
jgi:hypothetical protein